MIGALINVGVLVIVLLALLIWALVKLSNLVVRAWRQSNGKSRGLRTALVFWLALVAVFSFSAVEAAGSQNRIAEGIVVSSGILLLIATLVLVVTARVVELKYRRTFVGEPETLVTKVLRRPWWTTAQSQAA
jgi:hypothetical protein